VHRPFRVGKTRFPPSISIHVSFVIISNELLFRKTVCYESAQSCNVYYIYIDVYTARWMVICRKLEEHLPIVYDQSHEIIV